MLMRWQLLLLLVTLAPMAGASSASDHQIVILEPQHQEIVVRCQVEVGFRLEGEFVGQPTVKLNFRDLEVPLVEGPPGSFHGTLAAGDGLGDGNLLVVRGVRADTGETITRAVTFRYTPPARAYRMGAGDQPITGPLAHNRAGDFMLESCVARFAIQDGKQRDLYSVGGYGGNIIDAERIGRPGLDNFLELQPMVNVETVINAQDVFIVNDGSNGEPAVVRACGPDDLLDFVNPSSPVIDLGLPFPPELNDNDQTVEGCTDYRLAGRASHLEVDTTLTNVGNATLHVVSGDWLNQAGELDVAMTPNQGVGSAITNQVGSMAFVGFDEAAGVDYSYTSTPESGNGSYVVISGVVVILHSSNVLLMLLGLDDGVELAPGESHVMKRYFGVGDGSAGNAVDLELEVKGLPRGQLRGCVTIDGDPAPGAKVAVGRFDELDELTDLITHFTTDASGCYAGSVPLVAVPTRYGVAAARAGVLYQGGGTTPPISNVDFYPLVTRTLDFDLPATGSLRVDVTNEEAEGLPARVSVVGFDPSPPILFPGPSLPGFGGSTLGLFEDPVDRLPFGIVRAEHTDANGVAEFDLEPGSYRVVVSRGTEYSISEQVAVVDAGEQTVLAARIAAVLDTAGFVSSDFHVHGINSADSRVSHEKRVRGYAGEGVDNIIMTDHHVHTDLTATIASLGMSRWVSSTIGEEITTFDSGHYNAYPLLIDPKRISGGSTDWAVAAPPGEDFPSAGAFNATPAEIFDLATAGTTSTPDTTIQINHISSHFAALQIDTSLEPPRDNLDAAERLERRLDEPVEINLFHPFPALELWNGDSRGAQNTFLNERIGIWFNLLNQGFETTFIADTDSHKFTNLNMAGARTWTAAAPWSDQAGTVDSGEVANMVDAGRATAGQGVFVTTRLRSTDGSGDSATLQRFRKTHMTDAGGNVELDIRVQAPIWAAFDRIEIYANAVTTPVSVEAPYLYGATPIQTLLEGDCLASTAGDGDFDLAVIDVAPVPGGSRLETVVTVPFNGLTEDTWFVVVVRGSDGLCPALFPVFASGLDPSENLTAEDLLDGNVGEAGVLALGATNALYFDAPDSR